MNPTPACSLQNEPALHGRIAEVADELCEVMDDHFDFTKRIHTRNEVMQRLQLLVDEALDSARRAAAESDNRNQRPEPDFHDRVRTAMSPPPDKARLQRILDATAEAIITIDAQGLVTTFNAAAAALFGHSPEEIVGRNISMIIPAPLAGKHDGYIQRYLETGRTNVLNHEREVDAMHRDGSVIPVKLRATEMQIGGERSFVGCIHDLTAQRQAEVRRDELNMQLQEASRRAGMSEVATGVLHNVGNVLNSVNVAVELATDRIRASHVSDLTEVAALMRTHQDDLEAFLFTDERGVLVPSFLSELAERLNDDRTAALAELDSLRAKIEHIKEIINVQQSCAKMTALQESVSLQEIIEDALEINGGGLDRHEIQVERRFNVTSPVEVDRQGVLQILVNLISNAKHALTEGPSEVKLLTLRVTREPDEHVIRIDVSDNGVGIAPENLTKIFSFGFTTKKTGRGFGLHSASLAAQDMGGDLTVQSPGLGRGSTFSLELPLLPPEASA